MNGTLPGGIKKTYFGETCIDDEVHDEHCFIKITYIKNLLTYLLTQ